MTAAQDPIDDSLPLADLAPEPVPDGSDIPTGGQFTNGIGVVVTGGIVQAGTQPTDLNAI